MSNQISIALLGQLRRDAKRVARRESKQLSKAQDQIAQQRGFQNWSQLAKHCVDVASAQPTVPDTRRIYYLHGDQYRLDPARYYCALCDVFETAEHVTDSHGARTVDRYLDYKDTWFKRPASWDTTWHRPADTVNVLKDAVRKRLAVIEARETSRSAFHRWIYAQVERTDPIGDLARDIVADGDFPVEECSIDGLVEYLNRNAAVDGAIAALRQAFAEHERYQGKDSKTRP